MDIWALISGAVGCTVSVLGAVYTAVSFARLRSQDKNREGERNGTLLTEIGYIKAGVDDIKQEQKEQRRVNNDFASRLAGVESSAKQAHKRIDRLESKGDV